MQKTTFVNVQVKFEDLRMHAVHHAGTPLRVVAFSSSASCGAHREAVFGADSNMLNNGYATATTCRLVQREQSKTLALASSQEWLELRVPLGSSDFDLPLDTNVYLRMSVLEPSQADSNTLAALSKQDPDFGRTHPKPNLVWSVFGSVTVPLRDLIGGGGEQLQRPVMYNYLAQDLSILQKIYGDSPQFLAELSSAPAEVREFVQQMDTPGDPRRRGQASVRTGAISDGVRLCEKRPAVVGADVELVADLHMRASAMPFSPGSSELELPESHPGVSGMHFSLYAADSVFGSGQWFMSHADPESLSARDNHQTLHFFSNAVRVALERNHVEERFFLEAVRQQLDVCPERLAASTLVAANVVTTACSLLSQQLPYHFDGSWFGETDSFAQVEQFSDPALNGSGDCEDTGSLNARCLRVLQRLQLHDASGTALAAAQRLARHFLAMNVMSTVLAPNMDADVKGKKGGGPHKIGSEADRATAIGGHMYAWMVPLGAVFDMMARVHGRQQAAGVLNSLLQADNAVHLYSGGRFTTTTPTTTGWQHQLPVLAMEGTCESLCIMGSPELALSAIDHADRTVWSAADKQRSHMGDYLRELYQARALLVSSIGAAGMYYARHVNMDVDLETVRNRDTRISEFYHTAVQAHSSDLFDLARVPVSGFLCMQPSGSERIPDGAAAAAEGLGSPAYGVATRDLATPGSVNAGLLATQAMTSVEQCAMRTMLSHAGPTLLPRLDTESVQLALETYGPLVGRLEQMLATEQRQRATPQMRVARNWKLDPDSTHVRVSFLFAREVLLRSFEGAAQVVRSLARLHEAGVDRVSFAIEAIAAADMPGAPLLDPDGRTIGNACVRCDILVARRNRLQQTAASASAHRAALTIRHRSGRLRVQFEDDQERQAFRRGLHSCNRLFAPPDHLDARYLHAYQMGRKVGLLYSKQDVSDQEEDGIIS